LLLDRTLTITAANQAHLNVTGRTLEDLYGRNLFDAFPDNPDDPDADGVTKLDASLQQVLRTRRTSEMWVQRYDVPGRHPEDPFVCKWWSPVNTPVLDSPNGELVGVLHHVEDVTATWAHVHPEGRSEVATDADVARMGDLEWGPLIEALAVNERVHHALVNEAKQIREALSSRIVIEQAKGIIMADRHCGPEEAFDRLRKYARSSNLNIHDLAAALVASARANTKRN
jgi:hypothetical protein